MTQLAIQLPDELGAYVDSAVQEGSFASKDDFFANLLYNFKAQEEEALSDEDTLKINSLRADLQIAANQLDQGARVQDWSLEAFLAEMHLARKAVKAG